MMFEQNPVSYKYKKIPVLVEERDKIATLLLTLIPAQPECNMPR